ncbi:MULTISPECIES: transglutaminase-like domain-containing protein [Mycobacterium]|uniref:transglutaminase-like domain-containing protein n=1 Tax=Mycobacterium TaxID=1763 RepID=UPI00351CD970
MKLRRDRNRHRDRGKTVTKREVGASLQVRVTEPTTLEFQIAVAALPGLQVNESLKVTLDGTPVTVREVAGDHGSRIHTGEFGVGDVRIDYEATVTGRAEPPPINEIDASTYLRPSRYAEADKFFGFAGTEFGQFTDSVTVLEKVSSWVGTRLKYVPGSSDPIDGATDTLLAGAGVCRDYAHLVIALLRAVNIPARLVSVYAPGCDPMDFHAVAEALIDGQWRVVDATCLAPRQAMLRIATGRDAADTAFLDNHRGAIELSDMVVTAVTSDDLPRDSVEDLVTLG